jgi:WD40 repeat protein
MKSCSPIVFTPFLNDNITLKGHTSWVRALVELKECKLATASNDNTLKIWDLKSNNCIKTITTGHTSSILCLIQF